MVTPMFFKRKDYNDIRREQLAESLNLPTNTPARSLSIRKDGSWVLTGWIMLLSGILFVLFHVFFAIAVVSGPSMEPTLHNGQVMVLSKTDELDRFDIVVLKEREVDGGSSEHIVKRVIGLPGDRITVVGGDLFINNQHYKEPYLDAKNLKTFRQVHFDITVPEGYIFVMGDNRDVSKDSRTVGSFKLEAVVGVKVK